MHTGQYNVATPTRRNFTILSRCFSRHVHNDRKPVAIVRLVWRCFNRTSPGAFCVVWYGARILLSLFITGLSAFWRAFIDKFAWVCIVQRVLDGHARACRRDRLHSVLILETSCKWNWNFFWNYLLYDSFWLMGSSRGYKLLILILYDSHRHEQARCD